MAVQEESQALLAPLPCPLPWPPEISTPPTTAISYFAFRLSSVFAPGYLPGPQKRPHEALYRYHTKAPFATEKHLANCQPTPSTRIAVAQGARSILTGALGHFDAACDSFI